jgi:hypothetical protein
MSDLSITINSDSLRMLDAKRWRHIRRPLGVTSTWSTIFVYDDPSPEPSAGGVPEFTQEEGDELMGAVSRNIVSLWGLDNGVRNVAAALRSKCKLPLGTENGPICATTHASKAQCRPKL